MAGKKKIRTDFRKNREVRTRENDLTDRYLDDEHADAARVERVRAKGKLSRRRTVAGAEIAEDDSGTVVLPEVDPSTCREGRVLRVQGLHSVVEDSTGRIFQCATRRLLKTLSTDQRHVVAAGDRVWFRPAQDGNEGIIERVEPRHGVLSRTSRGRQHVIVANVDQLIIVTSAAEPRLKPNLIDRLLVTAERAHIRPVICINKIDLVDPAELLPLVGVYGQLGYRVLLTSSVTSIGIDRLRQSLAGMQSVMVGQSGVGKSSLLNAVEPGLDRRVRTVSQETDKGRHTTTTAELIKLSIAEETKGSGFSFRGKATDGSTPEGSDAAKKESRPPSPGPQQSYVVDTPGIRQFELWDVISEEVAGYFRDIRPFVSRCRFPDCTHTHEDDCAVKDAVADGLIDTRRYESYMQIMGSE